jgi:hypothetical protein
LGSLGRLGNFCIVLTGEREAAYDTALSLSSCILLMGESDFVGVEVERDRRFLTWDGEGDRAGEAALDLEEEDLEGAGVRGVEGWPWMGSR